MDQVIGVINLLNENNFLKDLTKTRTLASVPFGGRYRLIDFTLSSFIHAGISRVAVFTNQKSRALMDHLGSGKEWDLDRHYGGLFFLPTPSGTPSGDLQQFYRQLTFFERSPADTVVIAPGHHVCKIDYRRLIEEHRAEDRDITLISKLYDGDEVDSLIYHTVEANSDGTVKDIEMYTKPVQGEEVLLETYIIKKSVLIEKIHECIEKETFDLLKDLIKANLPDLSVHCYSYDGFLPFIHSVDSFYNSNLACLDPEVCRQLFYEGDEVFTKVKHEAPTKYVNGSQVTNSLIANGCDIHGTVENSVLFRGVKVEEGAVVKNCIIMQKGEIKKGAVLENVVADKQVTFLEKAFVKGIGSPVVLKKSQTV